MTSLSPVRRKGSGLALAALVVLAGLMLVPAPAAQAERKVLKRLPNGVQRVKYRIGPLDVTAGQNRIRNRIVVGPERPAVDGWIVRMKPDLVWSSGPREGHPPSTEKVMFHHGVFANLSRRDATTGSPYERFMGSGEEKTIMSFPRPFAYRYKASDVWALNEMIHNLTAQPMKLDISYTVDFIPDGSPAAEGLRGVRPVWMDVENFRGYPVFDTHKGSGGGDGVLTYPDEAKDPYPNGIKRNLWTVDRDGVLVATAGHVHTGGLSTDLYLHRDGAKYAGPRCKSKPNARRRACRKKKPSVEGEQVHLFRSAAKYYEPAGPVSWDVSMKGTPEHWRVGVREGDTLEITTDYETKIGSWYESMGIMVVYMADGGGGKDPYKTRVDYAGQVTHGHLPENSVHGGRKTDLPDPRKLPSGASTADPFLIAGFSYAAGDFRIPGAGGRPPTVKRGQSLTYELGAADAAREEWHSLTSCAPPCNRSTGIAYPLPDSKFRFDSGQLGDITPAVGRRTWSTPKNLPIGTYTYFCRIHPLMRGAFRVVK